MAYTTVAKVRSNIPGFDHLTDAVITEKITMADNIINGKIASRYELPFSTTPPLLETISTDLASYFILRREYTQDSQNKNNWTSEYKLLLQLLDDINLGKIVLTDSTGGEIIPTSYEITSDTKDYIPIFDVDDVEESIIDSDRLTDISDSKE